MITLQDILLFEQLQQKSFMDFDGGLDDILALMYVHDHKNRVQYTFKFYKQANRDQVDAGNPSKELRRFIAQVNADMQYVNQFSTPVDSEKSSESEPTDEHARLTPAIQSLLFQGGLNAQWLLQQGMDMLPILTEGYEKMQQQKMEDQRFTILQLIAPHIKKSSFQQLKQRWKFPWEREPQQEISDSLNNKIARFIFGTKK